MRSIFKVWSFLITLVLVVQPVMAEELISEESILSEEITTEETIEENEETLTLPPTIEEVVIPAPTISEELPVTEAIAIPNDIPQIEALTDIVVEALPESKTDLKKESVNDGTSPLYVADQVIVKYKTTKINLSTTAGRKAASSFANAKDLELVETLQGDNVSVFEIVDSKTVSQKVAELKKDATVEYVQPNYQYYPATISTNDTYKNLLWALDNDGQVVNGSTGTSDSDIDAPQAWNINEGTSAQVIVAIIDSGVAYNHPDLVSNMWDGSSCKDENGAVLGGCNHGYDFQDNDKTPLPTESVHGTHLAGIIAGIKNNNIGVIGVAPHVKIMALKSGLTTADIVQSINFAKQNGAKIINASWGGPTDDPIIYAAIASFPGLFIAAAGNTSTNNDSNHQYPSDYNLDNIISVTATDQNDILASFASYSAQSVDVGAPGTNIYSTTASIISLSETMQAATINTIPTGWTKDGIGNNWGVNLIDGSNKALFSALQPLTYSNNASTSVKTPVLNFGAASGVVLSFSTQCDTEYDLNFWTDYMELYSSSATSSELLYRWDETTIDDNNSDVGASPIVQLAFALPVQHLTNSVQFRFEWHTNSATNTYEGCVIDNIEVEKFSDGNPPQYLYADGTSMATAFVTGLAALIEGYNASITPTIVKNIILTSGDDVASLAGKTVSGKRINAYNAMTLANPFDSTPPIISLNGNTTINIERGTAFTDPGATANDVVDGNLTSAITSSSNLDINTVGSYTIIYSVIDSAGNQASTTRTVTVSEPASQSSGGGGGGGGGSSKKNVQSVTINANDAKTTSRDVILTLVATANAKQMQIANSQNFTGVEWIPFKKKYAWTLPANSGKKTVYVQFGKDNKVVGDAHDSITLALPPSVPVISPTPQAEPLTQASSIKPIFTKILKVGMRDPEVTELQKILISKKYLNLSVATGYFGPLTTTALMSFQSANALNATGIVDTETITILNKSTITTPTVTSSQNSSNDELIKVLQAKILELLAQLRAMQ